MHKLGFWFFLFIFLFSQQALAYEKMSNEEMNNVSGQAGVSIMTDDYKMYMNIDGIWYTDTDGVTSTDSGASIGLSNLSTMVHINAITSYDSTDTSQTGGLRSVGRPLQGNYDPDLNYNNYDGDTKFISKPLTIDVTERLPALSAAATYNNGGTQTNIAGVHIGLPTAEIVLDKFTTTIEINDKTPLDGSNDLDATNKGATYGKISIGKTTLTILDGTIEIAPH